MENGQVVEPQHLQQDKRWKPNSVLGENLGIVFLHVGCETKNTLRHIRSSCSFLSGCTKPTAPELFEGRVSETRSVCLLTAVFFCAVLFSGNFFS